MPIEKIHRFILNLIIPPTMVDSPILQHTLSDEISYILLDTLANCNYAATRTIMATYPLLIGPA